jgi:hypothetical protein
MKAAHLITQRHIGLIDSFRVLEGWHAFSGESGLFDLQRRGDEEPTVCRDDIAGLDQYDVSWHNFAGIDLDRLAVAAHPGDLLHHSLQGSQTGLGLGFLPQPHHCIEQRQKEKNGSRSAITGDDLIADRCHNQDDLHEILILTKERLPAGLLFFGRYDIRTVRVQPGCDLGRAQSGCNVDIQTFSNGITTQSIPGSVGGFICHLLSAPGLYKMLDALRRSKLWLR